MLLRLGSLRFLCLIGMVQFEYFSTVTKHAASIIIFKYYALLDSLVCRPPSHGGKYAAETQQRKNSKGNTHALDKFRGVSRYNIRCT